MSEERFEQDQGEDKSEDVEAHRKKQAMANEEPSSEEESEDVEAHVKRVQQKRAL